MPNYLVVGSLISTTQYGASVQQQIGMVSWHWHLDSLPIPVKETHGAKLPSSREPNKYYAIWCIGTAANWDGQLALTFR